MSLKNKTKAELLEVIKELATKVYKEDSNALDGMKISREVKKLAGIKEVCLVNLLVELKGIHDNCDDAENIDNYKVIVKYRDTTIKVEDVSIDAFDVEVPELE